MDLAGLEHIFADFERAITSPPLKEVAYHWRELCAGGRMPCWNDIRPSAIKRQLPIVWCYDYDAVHDDFVGRLAGNEIASLSSTPFKNARLSQIRPNDKYPRSMIRAKRVVQEPALYRGHGLVYQSARGDGFGERIVMPLRSEGSIPAGIFGATAFKTITDKSLPPDKSKEDEQWFSLAGLFEMAAI